MSETLDRPPSPRCESCGEERLIEIVTDRRGTQLECKVCSVTRWLIVAGPPLGIGPNGQPGGDY